MSGGRPRTRPPWWPEDETWPPAHWPAHRWGRHRQAHGPSLALRFGCALLVLAILLGTFISIVVWVVGSILGRITGPPGGGPGLILLLVLGIAIVALVLRGVRRMSTPLDELAEAAERIERGDFSVRVTQSGPPRVRLLARTFNAMAARLAAVDADRRAFLADAAHELRTPLTVIAGQLEAIEDGLYPADAEHLAPINEQIRSLEKLIDDIRTVAQAEAGALTLHRQLLEIGAAIENAVTAFQPQAVDAGVSLTADYPPLLPTVTADEQRVRQVLANLISNALRHTAPGGHVTIAARAVDGPAVEVSVTDDGSGIPRDLLPHVFNRFAREPGSPGSGLGLAISRDLVEAHGGTIGIESEQGSGTRVAFTLPM